MTTVEIGSKASIGIALQSAEGTGMGTAAFSHPLVSGLPKPVETINDMGITELSTNLVPGIYKSEQHWEADLSWWATPRATGVWLKAILSSLSTSGAGDPYTHTFTPAASPSFATLFATAPGTAYRKFVDGTIAEFNFNFQAGEPLICNAKLQGYTPSDLSGAYDSTVTEAIASSGSWFSMVGATLKVDNASTPASTTVATIKSGTISLSRDLELHQTDGFNPEHRSVGKFRVGLSLELIYSNYQLFKATHYGSTTGTDSSALPVFGSVDFTFAQAPTSSANRTLQLQMPNVALRVPEPPDADPSGGPVMVSVAGMTAKPSSGEIFTAILKSSDSTY